MTLNLQHPLAIAMWDFSWLERRWPGAGYEDWKRALDELAQRGYDAVRIDAYPHLHAAGADRSYTILPWWNQHDWGSPASVRVTIQPDLNHFIRLCHERNLRVALSTWYQQDTEDRHMMIPDATTQGAQWALVLDAIAADGLLDAMLFVDLCNEWPSPGRAKFFITDPAERAFHMPPSLAWMRQAIQTVRQRYPGLNYCFSFPGGPPPPADAAEPLHELLDLFEPHLWMAHGNDSEFHRRIDYHYERFDPVGYEKIVDRAEPLYRASPAYWQGLMLTLINQHAEWSRQAQLPLVTTECWGIVNYKDWPGLNWDWVKELCELGTQAAAATGRWAAIATSNFCGPQFTGMWRDIDWHRRLTDLIHQSALPEEARAQCAQLP